ncbi:unnamed protein product [Candidula unifasciata]|uniref:Uncharacterized protein n=1 Tax=Candidula unifasciata TaxID=100452 RepID=A0A8S3ZN10_9EUPU|nr:unnamed protein product [Candidula unifasciata]
MSKMKARKNLPVHIVEPHNDAVPFLHWAIASRLLPYSGIPVVHFDSHPDLLIPINLQADVVFKPQLLYESISIENWLLPLTYAKHLNQIVCVKPPWRQQIKTPEHTFSIGKCTATGKLRLVLSSSRLADAGSVKLTVIELLPDKHDEKEALRRLYHYSTVTNFSDENIGDTDKPAGECCFVSHLETKWFGLKLSVTEWKPQSCSSLADFTGQNLEEFLFLDSHQQADLNLLCRSCLEHREEKNVTFIMLHYFGCTLDDTELPHHISTLEQVRALQTSFKNLLEHLPKPTIVTIARSSDDGYCPKDVVDQYRIDILNILEELYGPVQINKHYE